MNNKIYEIYLKSGNAAYVSGCDYNYGGKVITILKYDEGKIITKAMFNVRDVEGFVINEHEKEMVVRDCENCVNHTANGCAVWECAFEPQESEV